MISNHAFPSWPLRAIMGALALFGLAGVLPVSLAELRAGGACPHLGPLPACHLVSLGYSLALAAVLSRGLWARRLFFVGWAPVFLLAAGGSVLELLGQDVCPKTAGGWPKCFFSFALAAAIILPLLAGWFIRPKRSS